MHIIANFVNTIINSIDIAKTVNIKFLIIFFTLLTFPAILSAQKPARVKLLKANDLTYDSKLGKQVQRLIGNVILKHDSTLLYCDSAYLNEATNSFDGFGNIRIEAPDSLNIYSDILNYDGNTKIAELHHNVRLEDTRATLYTEHLWYNRENKIAYYTTGGKIVDSNNVLTSIKGYYYTSVSEAFFRDSVILTNPKYVTETDTMKYNTETEVSFFYGPTTITSEENMIYCENGWYDTRKDKSFFRKNSYIITKEQILRGDSLFYDRRKDFGLAHRNVSIHDTVQDIIIYGNYGEFKKRDGYSFITDSAIAVMTDEQDSLFLHADTLWIYFDKNQNAEFLSGYYHSKFYRNDLQGMCDSLVYSFSDSTIYLYNSPVLWSGKNQLTADSVWIALANKQIDTLAMVNSSFIISMDDTISKNTFNQIKGKSMTGYFKDNELYKISVSGNSQTLYFIREENGDLIGVNVAYSSNMLILLKDNEMQSITYINKPEAHMHPPQELKDEELFLKGFQWIDNKRPLRKKDIFIW